MLEKHERLYQYLYMQMQSKFQNARVCRVRRQLSFLCDLHSQLQTQSLYPLLRIYDAHRHLFEPTSRANLQIVVGN